MTGRKVNTEEDEITIRELFLKLIEYKREVLKNWFVIVIMCFITSSYFLRKHFSHIPQYSAELRFVVEGQGGFSGGLGGILGTFGIKRRGNVNPYKLLEIGRSSKIFDQVIFSSFDGDFSIADKLISEYNLLENWAESNPNFEGFKFSSKENLLDREAFKNLKKIVWGTKENKINALTKFSLNDEKGIYSINTTSTSEDISIIMTTRFYENIKRFFEEETFENQKRSAEILSAKVDSVKTLKTAKVYQLGRFSDRNTGLLFQEEESQRLILNQEIQALNFAYGELVKNYEMTDVNLKDMQPLFMEIDRPFSPIEASKSSLIRNLILALFIGFLFGVIIVVVRKLFKDIMQ